MKDFYKHNLVNILASVFVGLGNWLYTFLILITLSKSSLANYSEFTSIFLLSSIPMGWLNYMFLKYGKGLYPFLLEKFLSNRILYSLLLALYLSFVTFWFLSASYSLLLCLLGILLLIFNVLGSSFKQVLQNDLQFVSLSKISVFEVLCKIVVFVLFVFVSNSEVWAYVGLVLQFFVGMYLSYRLYNHIPTNIVKSIDIGNSFVLLAFSIFQICFLYVDIIFVRNFLSSTESDKYIQVNTQLAKLILFFCLAFLQVLIPTLQKELDVKVFRAKIYMTSSVVILVGVSAATFFWLLWDKVYSIFKLESSDLYYLLLMIVSVVLFVLGQIVYSVLMIRNDRRIIPLTVFSVIAFGTILYFFKSNLESFLVGQILAYSIMLGAGYFFVNSYLNKSSQ